MSLLDKVSILISPNGYKAGTLYSAIPNDGTADMDVNAANYNALATVDDGECNYDHIYGCMDVNANNYDATATTDDGECTYSYVYGCMDSGSTNYDPLATVDNGSCVFIYHHTFKLRVEADSGIFESGDCLEAILTNLDTI